MSLERGARQIKCQASPPLKKMNDVRGNRQHYPETNNIRDGSPSPESSNEGSQDSISKITKRKGLIGRIFTKKDKMKHETGSMEQMSSYGGGFFMVVVVTCNDIGLLNVPIILNVQESDYMYT